MQHFGILSAILVLASGFSEDEWGSVFECRDEFETLTKLTQNCRVSNYITPFSSTKKVLDRTSGALLATVMDDYCAASEKVDACVKLDLDFSSCAEVAEEHYESEILKSNWMCRAGVKEQIADELSKLPAVSLKNGDYCYEESVKRTYACVRRFLRVRPDTITGVWNRAMASLPCAYRKLKKVCPAEEAKLLVLMNYDWLLFPPALGMNVSQILTQLLM